MSASDCVGEPAAIASNHSKALLLEPTCGKIWLTELEAKENRGARASPIELNTMSNARDKRPPSRSFPCIVYVFPELVTP